MTVLVQGNEIVLAGTVGALFWDDSFDATDVILALAQVGSGQDVVIRLNSGGGIATEGAAIHAALRAHQGKKTVIVEGIAASAASLIAMAGDDIVMAMGAVMMIHDPSGFTFGTLADHEVQIRALTALSTAYAALYAARSGKTVDEARADMQAEIWLSPEDAVAQGYADRVQTEAEAEAGADGPLTTIEGEDGGEDDDAPEMAVPAPFDFSLYQHPPERFVALARKNGWAKRLPAQAHAAPQPRRKEAPMGTKPEGTGGAAPNAQAGSDTAQQDDSATVRANERARFAAIMDSEEAKGREDLARHLAFETDTSAEAAQAILAKAPKAAPAAPPKSEFQARMDAGKNPVVGPDAPAGTEDEVGALVGTVMAAYRGQRSTRKGAN